MFQFKAEAAVVARLGGRRQRGVQVNVDLRMAERAASPVTRHLYSIVTYSPPLTELTHKNMLLNNNTGYAQFS